MNERPSVVVTGVSTGIGHAIAQVFTRREYRVFGSVRKPEDGDRLHRELGVTPLVFDVTDEQGSTRRLKKCGGVLAMPSWEVW